MANTPLVSLLASDIPLQLSDPMVSIPASKTFMSISEQPNITIIGAAAFLYTLKLSGSNNFKLCLHSSDIQANSEKLAKASNLSNISSEYYKFTNVFSKTKVEVFTFHCSYNFQINLEEGTQPPVGSIYSLLISEQEALKEFIEENLNTGFI